MRTPPPPPSVGISLLKKLHVFLGILIHFSKSFEDIKSTDHFLKKFSLHNSNIICYFETEARRAKSQVNLMFIPETSFNMNSQSKL